MTNNVRILAALAGIFFTIWPFLLNRSGVSGNVSAALFGGISLMVVMPFAIYSFDAASFAQAKWMYVVFAGIAGAIGVLFFNRGLSIVTVDEVATYFVIMVLVQISVPAIISVVTTGMNVTKLVGFMVAALAAYLLTK